MAGGTLLATNDVSRIEAPVTTKAYLMCAFAAFGGIFFGFDSGYISGVLGMDYFINLYTGIPIPGPDASDAVKAAFTLPASQKSLITSILSAGTFFGAILAGDLADWFGRRSTVILGSGRLIAGFGVGFVSAVIVLYISEIAPRKVLGAIVSGYQFCINIGILLVSCVDYATQSRIDTGSYRIPITIQMLWAIILAGGLFLLPESPRYFVKKGHIDRAATVLARLRGQPQGSEYIQQELAEIVANHEYEMSVTPSGGYFASWMNCLRGSLFVPPSNLRRTILGTSLQMMQQWTGVNFIFYFGTTFFQELGTISNPFLIGLITTLVNVCSTPLSFWIVERFGRRTILIWGALGMLVCEFIVAIVGVTAARPGENNGAATQAQIAFICIYIFFFATTWGPGAWVLIGELFPLPIRARGVALSTASNWLWNCIIAVITPYLVGNHKGEANLGSRVFFIWGSLCTACFIYAYLLVPETKGLSLEQVDRMLEETNPRNSTKWVPHSTFAADMGIVQHVSEVTNTPNNANGADNNTETYTKEEHNAVTPEHKESTIV
ncbi:putative glucose transporter rco-3 [Amylocarpus encephaloides]|uniref:Glucose transporter rco-3 n=1 Tax=Amylocarpus encephaloides TaxID=45428 RepID=A0A9P7YC71_9HELO|nr:putative glucose transporter rco-3 [Amylocarpus encephaloides]